MKKLLTILLLITLAGQSSGYFYLKNQEVTCMQETDEQGEKNGKEKKEKDYIPYTSFLNAAHLNKRIFCSHSAAACLSPQLDYVTPPPDANRSL